MGGRLQRGHLAGLHAEGLGRALRRLLAKPDPRDPGGPDTTEARLFQHPEHLPLRESTADSTGPEFRVVDYRLRKLLGADNIRNRDPAARLEHAEHLLHDPALAERKVDHPVGDYHVHRGSRERNLFHATFLAFQFCTRRRRVGLSLDAHGGVQIYAHNPAGWADTPRGDYRVETSPAPEIEHGFPWLQVAALVRVADASEGRDRAGGCAGEA